MKIIFMGTADFSVAVLKRLHRSYPVSAVVTGLDKPSGRGYGLKPSAVKIAAIELNIPVLQFNKVSKEGLDEIRALNPDLIVTASFGQILSDEFLKIPKFGTLNVHASLLPKYRGASPIQQAILNGEKYSGVTIMRTVREVDAGDLLLQMEMEIRGETQGELSEKLSALGGEAIVKAVKMIEKGEAVFTPQEHKAATHSKMLEKSDGLIDFSKSIREIDCFVRAMQPWPSAFLYLNGKMIKVFKVAPYEVNNFQNNLDNNYEVLQNSSDNNIRRDNNGKVFLNYELNCGKVLKASAKEGLIIGCGDGAVEILILQGENGKVMSAKDYLKGHAIDVGTRVNEAK